MKKTDANVEPQRMNVATPPRVAQFGISWCVSDTRGRFTVRSGGHRERRSGLELLQELAKYCGNKSGSGKNLMSCFRVGLWSN